MLKGSLGKVVGIGSGLLKMDAYSCGHVHYAKQLQKIEEIVLYSQWLKTISRVCRDAQNVQSTAFQKDFINFLFLSIITS